MFAQLGNIKFEGIKGFESLSRRRAGLYPQISTIKGKSRLQHTGSELVNISIGIRFHISFCNPEAEVAALAKISEGGEIVSFVLGTGEYIGDFIIADIQDDFLHTGQTGNIIASGVSLTLVEYSDPNKIDTKQAAAIANARGIQSDNIKPLRFITAQKPTDAGSVAVNVNEMKSSAKNINSHIAEIDKNPNRAAFYYAKMQDELTAFQHSVSKATKTLNDAQDLASKVPNLKNVILSAGNAAATFQSTFPPSSLNDVKSANNSFQTAVGNTNKESTRLFNLIATRNK